MQTKMNGKEWPIAPTFLSLRQGCNENTANYNTDGIYYTDYLRGFLADLSHDQNIQNALSLFQFVPKIFLPHDPNAEDSKVITKDPTKATVILNEPVDPKIAEILDTQNKKIIRIDSGTYVNNGRLCDAFRKCNAEYTRFCFIQDSIVGIFADEKLNELQPNTNEYHDRLEKLIGKFNKNRAESKIKCEAIKEFGKIRRLYVHYTCPYSLFEEHVFPIFSQGCIIACLMFGQVGRENFDNRKSFTDYLKEMEKNDPECLNILSGIKYVDENQWEKKVHTIVERIKTFEERLEERIEHRNTRYVNDAFEKIEEDFRIEVKKINIRKENVFSHFTNALNKAFSDIREKFDNSDDGFIRMFALPISIEHEELVPIGWSGSDFETRIDAKIALTKLKGIENTLSIEDKKERIKEQRRIILGATNEVINFDEEYDFFLPGWLAGNEVAYIVWKRHSRELRNNKNKKNFKAYRKALKNFYAIAQECYSYIRGAKMELLLETTIQESAHESTHFILPCIDVVEKKINVTPRAMIKDIYAEWYEEYRDSYERYRDEVLDSLNQLREINYGSALILSKELQINKKPEPVFYLLYKLKKLFSDRASDSHKDIVYSQRMDGVDVNIDAKYFNHALYNLLDNAIKYGFEGSYIRIKMDVDKAKERLNIEIVSYGIGIEDGDRNRIYRLFERSEDAVKMADGSGIGMYIVRKICRALGGDVTHASEKLSDYNIPLLINYKRNQNLVSSVLYKKKVFDDALSELSDAIEKEVVCDNSFVKYSHVFSAQPTNPVGVCKSLTQNCC